MKIAHKKQRVFVLFSIFIMALLTYMWNSQYNLQNQATQLKPVPVKGCFVILIRNSELEGMESTMSQIEQTFNKKYNYPYVFLNNEEFSTEFRSSVKSLTNARILFGKINETMWGYPDYINQTYAAENRDRMEAQGIPYGGSESYRHMCRFQSGFFFRHPLLDEFDYYWRLEPYVDYYCQLNYDVFQFMRDHHKKYGFNIAYKEHIETVPTLWNTTLNFFKENPQIAAKLPPRNHSLWEFVTSDQGQTYNTCHFWSNFEIGDLSLWRSEVYLKLFDYLDKSGGFFYERWGDAPVHSIAASLILRKEDIHFFNDIGYRHTAYTHCPTDEKYRSKCTCDPGVNFDFQTDSCFSTYLSAFKQSTH